MNKHVSIIIPAHNEAKVISATLNALLPGIIDGGFEVIVVCNGCTDSTAQLVAGIHDSIICLETPVPSKSNALNLGDSRASWSPRIYQDADVVLSVDAVHKIANLLREGRFHAAAPVMQMEYHNTSWAVRSYYEIWQGLPYVQEGMIGTGVYALSEQGRKRFDSFPDIIADDGYIRALFQPHERTSVENCWSSVRAPERLKGLLAIKTRSRRGQYELARRFPELMKNEKKVYSKALLPMVRSASLWPKLAVYFYVNVAARFLARQSSRDREGKCWERDESSRDAVTREIRD